MRSSIACVRCRRSKIRCVNNGIQSRCGACQHSGKDCTYPSPVADGPRAKSAEQPRESLPGRSDGRIGEGGERKRARKGGNGSSISAATAEGAAAVKMDVLDPTLLTPTVWMELFEIFQLHYSADLPFLHPPTFLKPLRSATMQAPSTGNPIKDPATVRPPASPAFLLAFLALTSRHHPTLVAHHSRTSSGGPINPRIAAEYYATAAQERIPTFTEERMDSTSALEVTQILLVLGLHEWGMCRGTKAWIMIGAAIRTAQAMGLQYEMDLDDEPLSRSIAIEAKALGIPNSSSTGVSRGGAKSGSDSFIAQEIRRRTFWSCYIMDRYLSSGKYRPQMLHAKDLRIQLPASEKSFTFGEKVRTMMLSDEGKGVSGRSEVQSQREASVKLGMANSRDRRTSAISPAQLDNASDEPFEDGDREGLVSQYVKMLEIYGRVVKWSCAGGRRIEEYPPWDTRSEFHQLRQQCLDFQANLPKQQTLTKNNTEAHIHLHTSTPYTLVHTVWLLCNVMLHREYVPFIPLRCSEPEGPLDAPVFSRDKYDIPEGFFKASARECFGSARSIIDLVRSCQEWGALVETPILGFAIYIVAFVGVYCVNFPWMDLESSMCTYMPRNRPASAVQGNPPNKGPGYEAADKALKMVGLMRPRLSMADGWYKTVSRMHHYLKRIRHDFGKNTTAGRSDEPDEESRRQLSLREGGGGGGLDEWKLLERTLKEFGNIGDQEIELAESDDASRPLTMDDNSSVNVTVKSDSEPPRNLPAPSPSSGPWNAINAGPAPPPCSWQNSASTPAVATANGQFRSYDSYRPPPPPNHQQHQHPQQQHQQPYPASSYAPRSHLPNVRSTNNSDLPAAGAPPDLTSPASRSASTPSQFASPFDHKPPHHLNQQPEKNYWTTSTPQTAAHPQQPTYSNALPSFQAPYEPYTTTSPYSAPPAAPMHPSSGPPPTHRPQQATWDTTTTTTVAGNHHPKPDTLSLDPYHNHLGGEDLSIFIYGGDISQVTARGGMDPSWLHAVYETVPATGDGGAPGYVAG